MYFSIISIILIALVYQETENFWTCGMLAWLCAYQIYTGIVINKVIRSKNIIANRVRELTIKSYEG